MFSPTSKINLGSSRLYSPHSCARFAAPNYLGRKIEIRVVAADQNGKRWGMAALRSGELLLAPKQLHDFLHKRELKGKSNAEIWQRLNIYLEAIFPKVPETEWSRPKWDPEKGSDIKIDHTFVANLVVPLDSGFR